MPRIPIFRLGRSAEEALPPQLGSYTPKLTLEGLQLGVDNLRHDVHLSPKFVEQARLQMAQLIMRHGDMEGLLAAENAERPAATTSSDRLRWESPARQSGHIGTQAPAHRIACRP